MKRLVAFGLTLSTIALFGPAAAEEPARSREEDEQWARWNDPAVQKHEPFQIFDNVYYVGIDWVSAYLVTTPEGHVLIDALFGDWADLALDNVRKLGFDPADIRYVLVTHGHFDHAGGARRIQEVTGARVGMTEADWRLVEKSPGSGRARFEPPPRDLVIADGDEIRLGDTTFRCYVTPGHTEGVLSLEFPVRDGDHSHRAFVFGGVGLNFEGVHRLESYLASVDRILGLPGIEVHLPNHAVMGRVFERAERLAERRPGEPHPFVDPDDFRESLERWRARAEKKLAEERASGSGS